MTRGTWVVQSVKRLTLDFGSGHDLMVCEIEPHVESHFGNAEPAWDSLSPSLSLYPSPTYALFLSLKITKLFKKENTMTIVNNKVLCT